MIPFLLAVISLSVEFDLSVTSWIRTRARNHKVGGMPHSLHMMGLAVDVVLDNETDTMLFLSKARSLGLIALDERDHIHLQAKEVIINEALRQKAGQ